MSGAGDRRWVAVALAVLPGSVVVWSVTYSFVAQSAGRTTSAAGAAALAMAMGPVVCAALSWGSGRRRAQAWWWSVAALLGALAVGVIGVAVVPGVLPGVVMGLATAAAVGMAQPVGARMIQASGAVQMSGAIRASGAIRRLLAIPLSGAVTAVAVYTVPVLAFSSAAVIGLAAVALADPPSERTVRFLPSRS